MTIAQACLVIDRYNPCNDWTWKKGEGANLLFLLSPKKIPLYETGADRESVWLIDHTLHDFTWSKSNVVFLPFDPIGFLVDMAASCAIN